MVHDTIRPMLVEAVRRWCFRKTCQPYESEDMQRGICVNQLAGEAEMLQKLMALACPLSERDVHKRSLFVKLHI